MTKKTYLEMWSTLKQVEELKGKSENMVKFRYAIAKNITMIEAESKILQKCVELKPNYKEYDKMRIALCEVHATKDENGKAILTNNQYDLVDETGQLKKEFIQGHDLLKEAHKEALEERDLQIADYEKLLDEECELKFYKFSIEIIPDDISGPLMKQLMPCFIEEE